MSARDFIQNTRYFIEEQVIRLEGMSCFMHIQEHSALNSDKYNKVFNVYN